MPNVGQLKEELDDLFTLKFISSAFTEASMVKLQKIRAQFEQNKEFYEELSRVYHLVRVSGAVDHGEKKKTAKPTKIISVALTSNQRFYGAVNVNLMRKFIVETKNTDHELMVIGTTGRDFLRSQGFMRKARKMVFAKDTPSSEETKSFLRETDPYDKVFVYYPKFKSLVSQEIGKIDITQAQDHETDDVPEQEKHILFEPEYTKILEFFSSQVRQVLFFRVILETDLARTAARLISMSSAEERSNEMISEKKAEIRKLQTSIVNRQLLETFAGLHQWKK